jgi:ABC-type uncharacterized transport system fused permease/ATPase subunit
MAACDLISNAYRCKKNKFILATDDCGIVAEDLNQFTAYVLSLSLGLLTAVVSLVSFLVILWRLSGPAEIPLGQWGTVHIPAYLIWTELFYAGVGTWLTVKIGRPLVPLNVDLQPRSSWPVVNKADDDGQIGAALGGIKADAKRYLIMESSN